MNNIRLNPDEITAIKEAFHQYFMENDQLWIFGSRVNPQVKGGDIDLYIETHYKDPTKIFNAKIDFIVAIKNKLGERKIDVVIKLNDNYDLPIYHVAKTEGVRLL